MDVTLDISNTGIRLLSLKGKQIQGWESVSLAPGLVKDGAILQPNAVGAAIDGLFKSANASKERVTITLTGLPFTYRILSLPRMKSDALPEAIQRGARKEMPLPLEELYLSWHVIDSSNEEMEVFVVGVPQNVIITVVETLAEAGIKPHLMDLKPLALARAADRTDSLIVSLEADCFDIVLVANGIPAIMHTITPREGGASTEDNIRQLASEVLKTVEFYNSGRLESPFNETTPILLTGELSTDTTTVELIQTETGSPVETLVPPLELLPELPVNRYATNIGLALKKVPRRKGLSEGATGFRDINLNILSGKYEDEAHPFELRRILVPLALAIAMGLMFPLQQVRSQADLETLILQTELDRVGYELREARLAVEKANQVEATINKISSDMETLTQEHQSLTSKGNDFTNYLQLVTDTIPSEVYFTSIAVGADEITLDGGADSPFKVVSYVAALEAQEVFPEVRIASIGDASSSEDESMDNEDIDVSFKIIVTK